jgi:dTDP-4-dehydrorhamnose reductase
VGWELQRSLAPLGELIALDRHSVSSYCGDLSDLEGIQQTIREIKPDVIVNAAAYTAVDKAEIEVDTARLINATAPALLAAEAAATGALLVHYSTDYVFDGGGILPWREIDPPSPCNQYGQTKLEGEQAIQASGCKYLIFRTSWVYGLVGNNFVKTILRLLAEKEQLQIISDQWGAPTSAELIADVTALVLLRYKSGMDVSGLYHLVAQGEVSWYGYANFILEYARQSGISIKTKTIKPIVSEEYKTPARRPLNSRLNTEELIAAFSLELPCWEEGVQRMMNEFLNT